MDSAGRWARLRVLEHFISENSQQLRREALAVSGLALILLAVALLYAPTLHDPFHGDDFVAFTQFKTKGFQEYARDVFLFKDSNFYWRPLGDIVHYALYAGFGFSPFAFRFAALVIFMLTLVGMYLFCVGERLGKLTALGAVLVFGLFPNHVVSVTWVTNTSRLMAGFFVIFSLLLIQRARGSRYAFAWEAIAFVAFVAACLSDETTTALAPVPFLYGTFVARRKFEVKGAVVRLLFYAAVVGVVVPLQFMYTIDDEARLTQYGVGPHMATSLWILASQLSLPLASGSPVAVFIQLLPAEEWAAGLLTLALLAALFLFGSRHIRLLVIWIAVSFAPFSLWMPQNISPRYVYLAAMPFAILVSWLAVRLVSWLMEAVPAAKWPTRVVRYAVPAAAVVAVAYLTVIALGVTKERNADWSAETAKYGRLREGLEKEFPTLLPGTRLVVLYGEWPDFWASAVARTIYGDPSLWVTAIPRERVEQAIVTPQQNDILVYLINDRLMSVNSRR